MKRIFYAGLIGLAISTIIAAGTVGPTTLYTNLPAVTPPNLSSFGYTANFATEMGSEIQLSGDPLNGFELTNITVMLSDWAKQSAYSDKSGFFQNDEGWDEDLTINIYSVGEGGTVGQLIGTKTQTSLQEWRPENSPACTGPNAGNWQAQNGNCYTGITYPISFDLGTGVYVGTNEVIVTLSFVPTAGAPSSQLNYAFSQPATVGTYVEPGAAYQNSTAAFAYCDSGAGGTGKLRNDPGCWGSLEPALEVDGFLVQTPEPDTAWLTFGALVFFFLCALVFARRRRRRQ